MGHVQWLPVFWQESRAGARRLNISAEPATRGRDRLRIEPRRRRARGPAGGFQWFPMAVLLGARDPAPGLSLRALFEARLRMRLVLDLLEMSR